MFLFQGVFFFLIAFRRVLGNCVQPAWPSSFVPTGSPFLVSGQLWENPQGCAPFTRALNAFGFLVLAMEDVDARAVLWHAQLITELFPAGVSDPQEQASVLQALYRHRAALTVFQGTRQDAGEAIDALSSCDSIKVAMVDNGTPITPREQVIEIVEHVLHVLTNVGLAEAWPEQWGLSQESDLYAAMQEAITNGVYDDSDYDEAPAEARLRLKLQEFAYWCLSTAWGVHSAYFDGSAAPEWTLSNASQLPEQLPSWWALHLSTTARTMGPPSSSTLQALGSLAAGQAVAAPPPLPLAILGRAANETTDTTAPTCSAATTGPYAGEEEEREGEDSAARGRRGGALSLVALVPLWAAWL